MSSDALDFADEPPVIRSAAPASHRPRGGGFGGAFLTTLGGCLGGAAGVLVVAGLVVGGCSYLVYRGMETAATRRGPEPAAGPAKDVTSLGPVRARVTAVKVGPVPLNQLGDEGTSRSDLISVRVTFHNTSKTRKVDFNKPQTWLRTRCRLRDDLGNAYKTIDFGIFTKVSGAAEHDSSIYPGDEAEDWLVFERPVPAARSLTLEIDGEVVGEREGGFRLTIPAGSWRK